MPSSPPPPKKPNNPGLLMKALCIYFKCLFCALVVGARLALSSFKLRSKGQLVGSDSLLLRNCGIQNLGHLAWPLLKERASHHPSLESLHIYILKVYIFHFMCIVCSAYIYVYVSHACSAQGG